MFYVLSFLMNVCDIFVPENSIWLQTILVYTNAMNTIKTALMLLKALQKSECHCDVL